MPPQQQERDRRLLLWLWPSLAVFVVLSIIGAVLLVRGGDDGEPEVPRVLAQADARLVDRTDDDPTFEAADEVGIDPFVPLAQLINEYEIELPEQAPPYGLYGGTLENTCDAARLADFLTTHAAQGKAWAKVHGIAFSDLTSFIGGLTPAVLSVDTAVTNHSFSDGNAVPIQAILEKGTAVLVDDQGIPRARCYCGNPLLPPKQPPPPAKPCLPIAVPLWIGYPGAPADPGNSLPILSPRPWKVSLTGASVVVAGETYVQLVLGFDNGFLHSVGAGGHDDVWVLEDTLGGSCTPKVACTGAGGTWTEDLEHGPASAIPAGVTVTLTGHGATVDGVTHQQVEYITKPVNGEPEFHYLWVIGAAFNDGPCAPTTSSTSTTVVDQQCRENEQAGSGPYQVVNVTVDDPDGGLVVHSAPGVSAPDIGVLAYNATDLQIIGCAKLANGAVWWQLAGGGWAHSGYLAPQGTITTVAPGGCSGATFDPSGKNVLFAIAGDFDAVGGVDTAYVYQQGSTHVQFELGGVGLTTAVDLGLNFSGQLRDIADAYRIAPTGSDRDVLLLWDRSTMGGAGNVGTVLVTSVVGCAAHHVTVDGAPSDFLMSYTVASPAGLACATSGTTTLIGWLGQMNQTATDVDYGITEYGYDPVNGWLYGFSFVTDYGPTTEPQPSCF